MSELGGGADDRTAMERPFIFFEVTRRCNRACAYCYAWPTAPDRDLSVARLDELLERLLLATQPRGFTLIGGEPLLNPELTALVRRLARFKAGVSLSTNALALTQARIDELVGAGVTAFEVSYDSPDGSVYARMTGSRLGPLQRTLTELVRAGVSASVGAMLTRRNLGDVEELLQLCFALGVRRVSLNQVALVGAARSHPDLLPDDNELATALESVNSVATTLGMRVGVGLPVEPCRFSHERFPALEFERCHCGRDKWLIEPSGDVRVCELAPAAVGNLLRQPWPEIVTSLEVQRFRSCLPREGCRTCQEWNACRGGCRFRLPASSNADRNEPLPS